MRPDSSIAALALSATLCLVAAPCIGAQSPPPTAPPSLYTPEQATRGDRVYQKACIECHEKLEYTGADFRVKWNGRAIFDLVDLVRSTMPDENPGTLTTQEYVDVVAYMMKLNGVPPGRAALPVDNAALKKIKIEIPATTAGRREDEKTGRRGR